MTEPDSAFTRAGIPTGCPHEFRFSYTERVAGYGGLYEDVFHCVRCLAERRLPQFQGAVAQPAQRVPPAAP